MQTWEQLERYFSELQPVMRDSWLGLTWGDGVYHWAVSGGVEPLARRRFEELARIAGLKVTQELPDLDPRIAGEDPRWCWYQALQHVGGGLRVELAGYRVADDSEADAGAIYSGRLKRPAEASAVLCLQLSTRARLASNKTARRLFLSHAADDRMIAEFLRSALLQSVSGIEVFLASIPGQIPAGADWMEKIKSELRSADTYLVLLTPTSIQRPWVWFETGAAWMRDSDSLITVTVGNLHPRAVPAPLSSFQVLAFEDPRAAVEIVRQLGGVLRDPETFCRGLTTLAESKDQVDWKGVEVTGRYFAWDSARLFQLETQAPEIAPPELLDAIRLIKLVPSYGNRTKLTNHLAKGRRQVFETDRTKWRREIVNPADHGQVLLVHVEQPR